MTLPKHIAIIMDGNGRWGLKRKKNRLYGHQKGIENIEPIIKFCLEKKIKHLSLYALSFENNLKRSNKELKNIFKLINYYLDKNIKLFNKKKIELNFIGEIKLLPLNVQKIIKKYNNNYKKNDKKITLNIALNYSSKKEIINSIKKINKNKRKINENNIKKYLYTNKSSDPDVIIRTGGYKRLSNFMLWQSSYSELFFLDKLWPDFNTKDLLKIISKFLKIKRNFGA